MISKFSLDDACRVLLSIKNTPPRELRVYSTEMQIDQNISSLQLSIKELSFFLNSRPKPSWNLRLEKFYQYKPELIKGWRQGLSNEFQNPNCVKPTKIILDKEIAKLYAELVSPKTSSLHKKCYKTALRGIEEYLKKNGYERTKLYQRGPLEFSLLNY
ncbi:hypothetical protein M0812_14351 [Anaeramoeba flamelloides]|uniref:Uncharacterized protein n=1 Tax=Anaeramoeba flamelloides TaxID=1746091 RepID=A0AAV7ZF79_9EUKA|nr:hypothetical protein M0812_14351 [Anaeramoeba flamelloides]